MKSKFKKVVLIICTISMLVLTLSFVTTVFATVPDIIVDNTDSGCTFDSAWGVSTAVAGYYGTNYAYDGTSTADPNKWAKFTPNIITGGGYDVYMRWSVASNRPDAAPIVIAYNGGTDTSKTVNQLANNNVWVKIGTYNFAVGTSGYITIKASDVGCTIADAVKLVNVSIAPTPTPTPVPTPAPTPAPKYVTTTGAGTKDGSSWANAFKGNVAGGMTSAWTSVPDGGILYVDGGIYYTKQTFSMSSGGSSASSRKSLIGVDRGSGLPNFRGNWTFTSQSSGNFGNIGVGVGNILIKDIIITQYFNAIKAYGNNAGIEIDNVDVDLMNDGIYFIGGATVADPNIGSHDVVIKNCDFTHYSKIGGVRLEGGCYNFQINNCTTDQGGASYWYAGNFPMGFHVSENTQDPNIVDHNITFNDCVSRNNWIQDGDNYWNGDGWSSERSSFDIVLNRCKAFDNTDSGFDLKSNNTTFNDCIAFNNNRNYRLWGTSNVTLNNCIAGYTIHYGGSGGSSGIGVYEGANVVANYCTLFNESREVRSEEAGNITLNDCIIAKNTDTNPLYSILDAGGSITKNRCHEYLAGVSGTDPQFVNGSNSAWEGGSTDFNSILYGNTKGWHYSN